MTDIQHSEQRIVYAQPYETDVKIETKLNAKGEEQPEVRVSISRKLEDDTQIIELIGSDIDKLIAKARNAMNKLKELG
jgi:hypothetical protein